MHLQGEPISGRAPNNSYSGIYQHPLEVPFDRSSARIHNETPSDATFLDAIHLLLDALGLIPVAGEPVDIINSFVYLVEGDIINANLSLMGAIPVAGWFSVGGRVFNRSFGRALSETAEVGAGSAAKTVDDILSDAVPGRPTSGRTTQYIKTETEGYEQAVEEFYSLKPTDIKDIESTYGPAITGILPDGERVTVRPGSSEGSPTLEIRRSSGRGIEIRYGK